MRSFTYGSRVVENERQVRLHKNVKIFGKLLHAVVKLCVTFFLFVLINLLLRNIAQNTQLTFVKVLRFVQESAELFVSNSALSAISFSQHVFCLMLVFTFTCVYQFGFVLNSMESSDNNAEKEKKTYNKYNQETNAQTGYKAIAYRHKVCFLS